MRAAYRSSNGRQALIARFRCNDRRISGNFLEDDVPMSSRSSSSLAPGMFPHTRWSVVLAAQDQASPQSAAAMEEVCRAYWQPLFVYARRCGQSPHDAEDLI